MDRADIVTMANELREAFLSGGADISEKRTVTGGAFFVAGHALGQVERKPNSLRVRLWLADKDRRTFEQRPTFDADSGWLHVVSQEDIGFIRGLIPLAHKAALSGSATATSSPTSERSAPRAATPPRAPVKRTATRTRREP